MIITTTPTIEGKTIVDYRGIVTGDAVMGANVLRDIAASLRDIFGGRAKAYEDVFGEAREEALREMAHQAELLGANAVVGVDIDYETLGPKGSILMVSVTGTAVVVR
ncbi:MAG: heavy metal-binding domain-containing protein [Candidatus Sumerlaeaceae bacterium]